MKLLGALIFKYSSKSARFCLLLVAISNLQIVSNALFLYPSKDFLLSLLSQILKTTTLSILASQMIPFTWLIISIFACLHFIEFLDSYMEINKMKFSACQWLYVSMPIILTALLSLYSTSMYCSIIFYFFFWVLWLIRTIVMAESPIHNNFVVCKPLLIMNISSFMICDVLYVINVSLFTFQIFVITINLTSLVYSLKYFTYVNPDLEYVEFVRILLCIFLSAIELLVYKFKHLEGFKGFCLIAFIALLYLGYFKELFEQKYRMVLSNCLNLKESSQMIILLDLLKGKQLKQQKYFKFDFVDAASHLTVCESPNKLRWFEKYYQDAISNDADKIKDLRIYLACCKIKDQDMIAAIKTVNTLSKSKFVDSVQSQLIWLQIRKNTRKIERINKKMLNSQLINNVFSYQTSLLTIKETCSQVNLYYIELNKFFQSSTISIRQVLKIFSKLHHKKKKIESMIKKECKNHWTKQLTVLYYIYLVSIRFKKYTVEEKLEGMFGSGVHRIEHVESLKSFVMISNHQAIVQANAEIKQFLQLNPEKLQQRKLLITDYMPRQIANCHNALVTDFLERGTSTFINQQQQIYIINRNKALPIQLVVNIFPYRDEISFVANFKILSQPRCFFIFNQNGTIENLSEQATTFFDHKYRNSIYEVFPTLPSLETISKKLSTIVNYRGKQVKLEINITRASKYFLGICKIESLTTPDSRKNISVVQDEVITRTFERATENYQYCLHAERQMQKRMFSFTISDLSLVVFVLAFITFCVFIYSNTLSISNLCSLIISYENSLYSGFRIRSSEFAKRFEIYHAIDNHQFPDNLGLKYNVPSLTALLMSNQAAYLKKLDGYDRMLTNYTIFIPSDYASPNFKPIMDFQSQTSEININFLSIVSLLKSFYYEMSYLSIQNLEQNWQQISKMIDYTTNAFAIELQSHFLNVTVTLNENVIQKQGCRMQVSIFAAIGLVTICLVFIVWAILKNHLKEVKFVKYSAQFDHSNKIGLVLASQDILQSHVLENSSSKQIFDQNMKTIKQMKPRNKEKEFVGNNIYGNGICKIVLVVISTIISVIFYYVLYNTNNKNIQLLRFYKEMSLQAFNISSQEAAIINSLFVILTNQNRTFFNKSPPMYMEEATYSVLHRQYETILQKYNVDWDMINQYMYTNLCTDPEDIICPEILDGALSKGLSATMVAFATLGYTLYNQNTANQTTIDIYQGMYQMIISYELYVRNSLNSAGSYAYTYAINELVNNDASLRQLFYTIMLPIIFLSAAWMLGIAYNIKMQIRIAQKQFYELVGVEAIHAKLPFILIQ